MNDDKQFYSLVALVVFVFFVAVGLIISTEAEAKEPIMVMTYNDNVRIVLSRQLCPMKQNTLLAVAQRIDKQYLRGCYTYEPDKKLVRIQWSADEKDFSIFDADRFKPAELP